MTLTMSSSGTCRTSHIQTSTRCETIITRNKQSHSTSDLRALGGKREAHQSVVEAEGADVIGRNVAVGEWLRNLGDDAAFVYTNTQKVKEKIGKHTLSSVIKYSLNVTMVLTLMSVQECNGC